ncbi:hypothetical protein BT96DRAFT_1008366 [Gymnopus androsaceus JB14]|uniref:Uncharacterized protein n=1 Tax=Gymnopus androsaceus JB14 TaxID=1447944 RepID=A0A6A4GFH4_9AGAR|nr:hypothetical protein BT96DRAFT_1008366 [Gymnopus androsaceus JB14]
MNTPTRPHSSLVHQTPRDSPATTRQSRALTDAKTSSTHSTALHAPARTASCTAGRNASHTPPRTPRARTEPHSPALISVRRPTLGLQDTHPRTNNVKLLSRNHALPLRQRSSHQTHTASSAPPPLLSTAPTFTTRKTDGILVSAELTRIETGSATTLHSHRQTKRHSNCKGDPTTPERIFPAARRPRLPGCEIWTPRTTSRATSSLCDYGNPSLPPRRTQAPPSLATRSAHRCNESLFNRGIPHTYSPWTLAANSIISLNSAHKSNHAYSALVHTADPSGNPALTTPPHPAPRGKTLSSFCVHWDATPLAHPARFHLNQEFTLTCGLARITSRLACTAIASAGSSWYQTLLCATDEEHDLELVKLNVGMERSGLARI